MKYFTKLSEVKIPTKKQYINRNLEETKEFYNAKPYIPMTVGAGAGATTQLFSNIYKAKKPFKKMPIAAAIGALAGGTLYALGRPSVQRDYQNPEAVKEKSAKIYKELLDAAEQEIAKSEARLGIKIDKAERELRPEKADRLKKRLSKEREQAVKMFFDV